jgi:hypothetical protein
MLDKQACYHLATGGHQVLHLTYWLGISLLGLLPVKTFADLIVVGNPPVPYADLLSLLWVVFSLECVL